jgi:hypothetical protein
MRKCLGSELQMPLYIACASLDSGDHSAVKR